MARANQRAGQASGAGLTTAVVAARAYCACGVRRAREKALVGKKKNFPGCAGADQTQLFFVFLPAPGTPSKARPAGPGLLGIALWVQDCKQQVVDMTQHEARGTLPSVLGLCIDGSGLHRCQLWPP